MDVTKADVKILSNEKEGEVSSTCSDNLPARSLSNNDIETGAGGGIAPSFVVHEEISHPDSPDTSGASSGHDGGEIHVIAEAESELSHGTGNIAMVQSQDTAVEQEQHKAESVEMFQQLPGESIELLNISEDSKIVLLDENVLISTTSEPRAFLVSYEKQEEMKGEEMSAVDKTGFQLEIPQQVNILSAGASENVEPMDVSSNETKICMWKNPDSTTVETTEGSSNGNENISFTEEEVSTTEEDVGNLVSTSSAMTSMTENVLDTSGDSTSIPSTTKTVYVCGMSVQEDVQDMQTSQSLAVSCVIIETAPQNAGVSTTSMKDSSQQNRRWDQVKPVAEISPVRQTSSQASDPVRQVLNPLPQASTCRQKSHVTVPEQSLCTSKKLTEVSNMSNPIEDYVSSSKDIEIVNKVSASTHVFPRHEESNIDTTTTVKTVPLLSSALDLIKSNYCSPFDDDIPSPGSSTYEEQKCAHDWTHQIGECSTSNSSSNEQLHTFTKDETSSSGSLNHQEKIISETTTSSENVEGRTSENAVKENIISSLTLPGPSKKSKENKETLLLESASASSVVEHNLQLPMVPVKQSDFLLSTSSVDTVLKDHAVQYSSSAEQTVPSFCRPSVSLRTNLLGCLKEMVALNNGTSVIDSRALVTTEKNSGGVSATVSEETKRQSESSLITDILAIKSESSRVIQAPTCKEPSCVIELQTTGKQPFSAITETVQAPQKSSLVTNPVASKNESLILVEASSRTESVTETPATRKECSYLTEVLLGKENNIPAEKKDSETSLKILETLHPVSEVQREEVLHDSLKVSTVEEETSVLGMKSYVLSKETLVTEKLPVKEKDSLYSATVTPVEGMDTFSFPEKMTAVGVEEVADNKQSSVKGSLFDGIKNPLSFIEVSDPGIHIPRKESKMSVKQTPLKEKEASDINKKLPEEILVIDILAPDLKKEIKISSVAENVSVKTNIQGPLRVLDTEECSEVVHVTPEEREIILSNTQISHKDVTSFIHPQGLERDTDISGLQEKVKEKEYSATPGKHDSISAVQPPVLRKDACIADMHTHKKDELLTSTPKVLERDSGNVMEALEINSAVADVLLPRNKDKEIIRKRLAEVIAKQKITTDSHSSVAGTPSTKIHTIVSKEFPVLAENLAATMKETIKKAISKIPDPLDLETVAPKQPFEFSTLASEGKVVLTQPSDPSKSLSTALVSESNKQQADVTVVEGLPEGTKDCTGEGNLTSLTKNSSVSVEFPVQTEDPLHRLGTLSTKEATPQTATAVRLGIKETLPINQTDFKEDSIIAEQLVFSKDTDKKEEKLTRENITVKVNRESSRKETQKLTESLGGVHNKQLTESSGAVASEQLKSSMSFPKKQRVKLVRPVLSKSRETDKPEYSLSVTPIEVTKSECLNSPTFKDSAVEMAVSLSQIEGTEIKMSVSMTCEKYDEISHSLSPTGKADLPCKGFDTSKFPTATEPRELEVLSKTVVKKVEKRRLPSTSEKNELLKSTEFVKDKPSKFSTSTSPGEIKKQELSSKGGEKTKNFSAEVKQSDAPISFLTQDVTGPEVLETLLSESTEMPELSSKAASMELPRLVACGEEMDSLSVKETIPTAVKDIVRSQGPQQTSKEFQEIRVSRSSAHSKIMQSSVSAFAASNECKYSMLATVAELDTCKNLEQPELLHQKDSDMVENKPCPTFKLQEILEKKHAVSEIVKKPKLIRPLKSLSKDVAKVETVSGSDIKEIKLITKEAIQIEGTQEVAVKQHKEEDLLCMSECTQLCTEQKGHENMHSSVSTKTVTKSSDQNTLTSKMLGDHETNIQKLDKSDRHRKTASSETINPTSESGKEKCQLYLNERETNREVVHKIDATCRSETSEIAVPHSASIDIPKGEGSIFAAQSRDSNEDIFHSDIIEVPVPNPSDNKSEHKEVVTNNRNVESVAEELVSEKTSLIYKQSQHLMQAHPTVSGTDGLKSNLLDSKSAGGKNFPLQLQFQNEAHQLNQGNVSCSAVKEEASAQVYSFKDTESINESLLPGQSEISSIKKRAGDGRSGWKPECSTSTSKVTQASKEHDRAIKLELVDMISVQNIASEGKTDKILVQDKVILEDAKEEDKVDNEMKLQELSTEKKSALSTTTSSKDGTLLSTDVKELIYTDQQKSEQVMKQDRIILKLAKDMTAFKESSSSIAKEAELGLNLQNSEDILEQTMANTELIGNNETSVEPSLVLPDSLLMSKTHAELEQLTLKPNKDGTNLKSSLTSAVSSNVEHSEVDISLKHENVNIKLKKDFSSSLSLTGTSAANNTEISQRTENVGAIAKVEKLTLKLKKDVSKPEDLQTEYEEEPKLEKITLKFKLDPAHHDIRVESTSTVMSNPAEIITKSPGVEQIEIVASPTSQDESKPQKITLKLKKDGTKQETVAVTSTCDARLETSVPVRPAEIKLPETRLSILREEVPGDKTTQKLKKLLSKSEAFVSPSKDNINQEITVIPVKLKDGKIQEKTISPGSKDKPAVEKFTVKLKKDSTSATTSKEDILPETTVTRVKAPEAKRSNENVTVGSRTEPLIEKITLKLKKDTTKPETVHPETVVTQVKSTEQPKLEAHVSLSSKEDPLVEKITLKLKKEGTKPETIITSLKMLSTQETTVVPTNITDIRQKQLDENVSSLNKESTSVEKITLKIKKDPMKQEVTPASAKQGHAKLTKRSTPVTQDEPRLEKLTLKLKKDIIKSAVVSGKEVEPPKQPDLVSKLDFVPREENKVEKLTLKLKKDVATSEVSTGKKLPEQECGSLDIQKTEESVVASSREEGKVEKLTLKFKKAELPEGDLEIISTQAEDVKCVDSAAASVAKEGKVEKIMLKLRKDLTKSEEASFSSPKEVIDTDGALGNQISGDQEKKLSEETSAEAGKQKKITLTLKKDAAWSVKRKKIKPEDTGDSFKQTGGTEMDKLSIQVEHHTEPPVKRTKMEEEMAISEQSDSRVTSSAETGLIISKVAEDLPSEQGKSGNSVEMIDNFKTEETVAQRPQDCNIQETLGSRRPDDECPPKKMKLECEMKSCYESGYKMSKEQHQDLILQNNQEIISSQILHSDSEDKAVSEGETFVQTTVEGKLREVLSKVGPGTNTILSGDLSVSLPTITTVSSAKSPEMFDTSVMSCQNEIIEVNISSSAASEDMHISVTNTMQQSENADQLFSEVLVREESRSLNVMIIEEENQPSSSVHLNNEKIVDSGMAVPDYCMEGAGAVQSPELQSVKTEVMKMEPKKGRGRPRKTALVPSIIPVVEPPEEIVRPKRMCRGRERPPVIVKVRKPRVGKGKLIKYWCAGT